MKMNRVPRGRRGVLTLLMVAALAFGQVPAGAFAFAATQTGSDAAAGATADTLDAQDIAIESEQEAGQAAGADGGTEEEEPNGRQDGPENEAQGTQDPEAHIQDQLEPAQDPATIIATDSVEPATGLTREVAGRGITTMAKGPTAPIITTATPTTLNTVAFTVTPPEAGSTSASNPTVTVASDANYLVVARKWVTEGGSSLGTVTFEGGQKYYIRVEIAPKNNSYTFGSSVDATCTGGVVTSSGTSSMMMNGVLVNSFTALVEVTATEATGESRIRWGSDSNNGSVEYTYTALNGVQPNGTQWSYSTYWCKNGTTATLKAVPKTGYAFVGWYSANYDTFTPSGSAISTDPTLTISVTSASDQTAYCAVFAEAPATYTVTVNTPTNGSVSADKTSSAAGDTVTLTVTPDSHYELDTLTVTDASNNPVTVNADNTFTMPASNVTVTATFKACMHENGETVAEVPATCTDGGVRAYWRCSSCGKLFTDETHATETTLDELRIPALGHDWGEGTVTTEPTCTDAGERTFTCSHDATHTKTEAIDALGHDWGSWTVTTAPTCTEAGSEKRVCGHDASHTETREVAALGHDWGPWTVTKEATEAEDGEEVRVCANDPAHTEARVIPHLVVEYRNTEGDGASWTKGSGEALTFVFKRNINDNATFSHFTGIQVDGADVDAVNYTAEAGNVVVTLNAGFLEGLSEGSHTVTALFDDGNSASAGFTVKAVAEEPADDSGADDSVAGTSTKPASPTPAAGSATRTGLPGTGDSMRAIPGLMAAMALCGLAMLFAAIRLRPVRPHGKHARR